MKKTIYFFVLILLIAVSCKKSSDFYEELGKGAYLTLVTQNNQLLNAVDPTSTVSRVVSSTGEPVESINLYVSANNTLDKTQWKLIKNIPFNGETLVSASNTEIATALGFTPGAIPPGNIYYLFNEAVTKDGRKFSSANTSQIDLDGQPAFNSAMRWQATVICPYDPATTTGTYEVILDEWEGRPVGSTVQVTTGPGVNDINLSQVLPYPANNGTVATPLVITVDPATGVATIPTGVTFASYTDFGGYSGVTGVGSTGFVFSCTGTISLNIRISAPPYGDQGFFQLIIKKQ
jgi:hypothetical protein